MSPTLNINRVVGTDASRVSGVMLSNLSPTFGKESGPVKKPTGSDAVSRCHTYLNLSIN
jgi:hypothetical protein